MTSHVDVEEIETTRSEKVLAFVLAAFLLIGGVWAYEKIADAFRPDEAPVALAPHHQAALDRAQQARHALGNASGRQARGRQDLEVRREAYRTALGPGSRRLA